MQELINPIEHKLDSVITRVATLIPLAFKNQMEFGECRENLLGKAKAYNMVINHFTVKAIIQE